MKYQKALTAGIRILETHGVEEPQADAWELFEYCTGLDRTHYFLEQEEEMPEEQYDSFWKLIGRRAERIPLQHLTGQQYFCGYEFLVNEHVLIPRHDTECLVEAVLNVLKPNDRLLDLCTGSGCILLAVAKLYGRELILSGSDLSEKALQVARENAKRLQVKADFYQGDLFEFIEGEFDCIVSNPPYIATGEIGKLAPEVKTHEPFMALDGKEDGLYFYNRIIREAKDHLKQGGYLLFEIGYDQGNDVSRIMEQEGYFNIHIGKDLAGLDRVAVGQRR